MHPVFTEHLINASIIWDIEEAVVSRTNMHPSLLGLKVLEGTCKQSVSYRPHYNKGPDRELRALWES